MWDISWNWQLPSLFMSDTKVSEFLLVLVSVNKSPFGDSSFTNFSLLYSTNLTEIPQLNQKDKQHWMRTGSTQKGELIFFFVAIKYWIVTYNWFMMEIYLAGFFNLRLLIEVKSLNLLIFRTCISTVVDPQSSYSRSMDAIQLYWKTWGRVMRLVEF